VRRRRTRRAAAVLTLLGALALPVPASAELAPPPEPLVDPSPPVGWPTPPELDVPVYLLVEGASGQVLAARAADERRPVASTVKILTALTVADRAEFDDAIVVGEEVEGVIGASVELTPGERWTVEQLLQGLLLRSGNDAAEAVAVAIGGDRDGFLAMMTEDAAAVGLEVGPPDGVVVTSPSGLDDEQQLSASDLATLARVLLADPELRTIVGTPAVSLPGIGSDENRNLLVGSYPGATGVKTGFTEAAGNSLVASAQRDDRELVVVVLGGGPDPERFRDAAALLDHGFTAFAPAEVGAELTLLVAGGTRTVAVEPATVTAPTGASVTLDLPLPSRPPETGTLAVPLLVDGAVVGATRASVAGEEPATVDGAARLGRAAVDGLYAALRAAQDGDRLP
jgi:D-alanyl-D-alanine carboxypeptidase